MRINEMFFPATSESNPEKELDFNLTDDLIFYMNNEPSFYRKEYFPAMLKFKKYCEEGKQIHPRAFKKLVSKAFEQYQNKFQVEGLKDSLSEEMCQEVCAAVHRLESENVKEGHYGKFRK
jgi:hypothetical protein